MNLKICSVLLLFLGLAEKSLANDSVVEVGTSGLIFSEEKNISMIKEKLDISEREISVQYEFSNDSKNDIEVIVKELGSE